MTNRIINRLWRFFKRMFLGRPVFDGRVRAYLTMRCNLDCDYCVNTHVDGGRHLRDYQLLPPAEWVRLFNALGRNVVITGGEPFLYAGLPEIIRGVDPRLEITIYSNLMVPLRGDVSWLQRKGLSIYGSYHPGQGGDSVFLENVRLLTGLGVSFTIHTIDGPGRDKLRQLQAAFPAWQALRITIDPDQRDLYECAAKRFRKRVRCQRRLILIAPDGVRYQCVSRLVRRVAPFENLLKEPLAPESRSVVCGDYGYCAPCDGLGENRQIPVSQEE